MTTNKVCGKGKCKFTDEFCASGDCPYDTDNVAKNVAQRNSQDKELMKKIFPHKEIIEGESVLVFPYIEEASPLKDVPQEVVSNMEKTIDHIADDSKKVSLTEQWKRGELESGWYYIEIDAPFEQKIKDINYYSLGSFDIDVDSNYITEVLAPVPSWEQWQQMKAFCEGFNALNVAEENQKLKELLRECNLLLIKQQANDEVEHKESAELVLRIDEVLNEKL